MISYNTLKNDRSTRARLRPLQAIAPWCFPDIFPSSPLSFGVVPIVTVGKKGEHILSLSSFAPSQQIENYFPLIPLGENFKQTQRLADNWVTDSLPIWLSNQQPKPIFAQLCFASEDIPTLVDGASAGLSLVLLGLSNIIKQPLPNDLICSATIDSQGFLGPVNGLERKIACVSRFSRFHSFVVCEEQKQEAIKICEQYKSHLTIKAYSDLSSCLSEIHVASARSILEELEFQLFQKDPQTLIEFLFYRALLGETQIFGWNSLRKTLRLLEKQTILSPTTHNKLAILKLISYRYSKTSENEILFTQKELDWLLSQEETLILQVWPHILEQLNTCPQTIAPNIIDQIIQQSQDYLPAQKTKIIAAPYIRILGAYGRYIHNTKKDLTLAFSIAQQAFDAWLASSIYAEASFPLCELLIIAGKFKQEHFHTIAKNCLRELEKRPNGITADNRFFILFSEMSRRHANDEDWKQIADLLLSSQLKLQFRQRNFVVSQLEKWKTQPN